MRKGDKAIIREALRIASDYWRRNALAAGQANKAALIDHDGPAALGAFYAKEAKRAGKLAAHFDLSDHRHRLESQYGMQEEIPEATQYARLAAGLIERDLLAPRGLKPAHIPIFVSDWRNPDWTFSAGVTKFARHGSQRVPVMIDLAPQKPGDLAATVAHELIHTALPWEAGHGPRFAAIAGAIGLEGPAEATMPGPHFKAWAEKTLAPLLANGTRDFWEA
jgi:hypothetical protein